MEKISAVILAAGMGVRMGPRGKLMPKGLLRVGGATLIEQSVTALRGHGVARIVIVTGHLREQYKAMFAGTDVELIHNPHYATTGSLLTLTYALERIDSACLILESDLIYAPQALAPLDGQANRFLVSSPTGAGDEEYVWAEPGANGANLMREVSKDLSVRADRPLGEMIGLSQLASTSVPLMRDVAAQVLARAPKAHYEPGFVALSRQVDVECPLLIDVPWAEIDDEGMLARAEREVFPRIAAARADLTQAAS